MSGYVMIFATENRIKLVNSQYLSSECIKRNEPYTAIFAIMFDGHLQALKHMIENFLSAKLPNGRESDYYTCVDEAKVQECLVELMEYLRTIEKVQWYEIDYRGKTMYKFTKPKFKNAETFRKMVIEGPLNILNSEQLCQTIQSYYQMNKKTIIERNLKYYYDHQDELRDRQKKYYYRRKEQAQHPDQP